MLEDFLNCLNKGQASKELEWGIINTQILDIYENKRSKIDIHRNPSGSHPHFDHVVFTCKN